MAHHRSQFKHDDFQFGFEIALGSTYRGAADAGEVLATAERISDGDADSWLREWLTTADAVHAAGTAAEDAGHRVTALAHHRRSATYYATALYLIDHSHEAARQPEIWGRQRECWKRIVELSGGERIAIPYGDTTLPGWFFQAADERRPLVVINNGSDGATSQMWVQGGAAALERGYHWMTFDGPGQQSTLFEQGIPFRHDWEAVLGPVADAMVARDDVDADRMAVIGVSQAGYWVPRALAFEHRFAAGVADPGVVDVSASWLEPLPAHLRKDLASGKRESFDREMRMGERFSASTRALLEFRGAPYGIEGDSRYDLYAAVMKQRLGDEVGQISTPMLVTDPEGEQFWPGQSQQLYERLPGPKELVHFTAAEGAGRHCEPLGSSVRDARIFDWLATYLG
ncbi:MAG TPA: prolyl oligopeptidase family serine peptidase [Solirubrobacteraceae bacterium]|nr:prolyl oligopeptidase family serine peptidase [Solirubrobacteraceae bacterium]